VEIADRLKSGYRGEDIKDVNGIMYIEGDKELLPEECVIVPSFDEGSNDKKSYAKATAMQYAEQDFVRGKAVAQLLITLLSCFTLGVVSEIWGLVEGIMILTGKIDKDAKGNPLKD